MIRIGGFVLIFVLAASCGQGKNPKDSRPVSAEEQSETARPSDESSRRPLGEPPPPDLAPGLKEEPQPFTDLQRGAAAEPSPEVSQRVAGPQRGATPESLSGPGGPGRPPAGPLPGGSGDDAGSKTAANDEERPASAEDQGSDSPAPPLSEQDGASNIAEEAGAGARDTESQDIAQNNGAETGGASSLPILTEEERAEKRRALFERLFAVPFLKIPAWFRSLESLKQGGPAFDFMKEGGSDLYYWYIQSWMGAAAAGLQTLPPYSQETWRRICLESNCERGLDFHKTARDKRFLPAWIKHLAWTDSVIHRGGKETVAAFHTLVDRNWDRWSYIQETGAEPAKTPLGQRPEPLRNVFHFTVSADVDNARHIAVNLPPQFDGDPAPFFYLGHLISNENLDLHIAGGCGHYCTAYLLPAARAVYIEPTGYIYYKGDFKGLFDEAVAAQQSEFPVIMSANKRAAAAMEKAEARDYATKGLIALQNTPDQEIILQAFHKLLGREENGEQLQREFNEKLISGKYEHGTSFTNWTQDQIKQTVDSFSSRLRAIFIAYIKTEEGAYPFSDYLNRLDYFKKLEEIWRSETKEVSERKGLYAYNGLFYQAARLLKDPEYEAAFSVPRNYYTVPEKDKHYEWIAPSAGLLRAAGLDVRGENNTDMLDFSEFARLARSSSETKRLLSRLPKRETFLFLDEKTAKERPFFVSPEGPAFSASEITNGLNKAALPPLSESAKKVNAELEEIFAASAPQNLEQDPKENGAKTNTQNSNEGRGGPARGPGESGPDSTGGGAKTDAAASEGASAPSAPADLQRGALQRMLIPSAAAADKEPPPLNTAAAEQPPFPMDSLPLKLKQILDLLDLEGGSPLYHAYLQAYLNIPAVYLPKPGAAVLPALKKPQEFWAGLCLEPDCRSGIDPAKLNPGLLPPLVHALSLAGLNITLSDDNDKQFTAFFSGRQFPRGADAYKRFLQESKQSSAHIQIMSETIDWMRGRPVTRIAVNLPHHSESAKDPIPFEMLGNFIKEKGIDLHIAGGCGPYCAWYLLPAARAVYIEPTGFIYAAGGTSGSRMELAQHVLEKRGRRFLKIIEEKWFPALSAEEAQEFIAEKIKKNEEESAEQSAKRWTDFIKNIYTLNPKQGDELRAKFRAAARPADGVFLIGDMTDGEVRAFTASLSPALIKTAAAVLKWTGSPQAQIGSNQMRRLRYFAAREESYFDNIELNRRLKSGADYNYRFLLTLAQTLVKDPEYAELFSDLRPVFSVPESEKPYDFVLYDADLLRKAGLNIQGENNENMIPVFFPDRADRFLSLNEERIESCRFFKGAVSFTEKSLNQCLKAADRK